MRLQHVELFVRLVHGLLVCGCATGGRCVSAAAWKRRSPCWERAGVSRIVPLHQPVVRSCAEPQEGGIYSVTCS